MLLQLSVLLHCLLLPPT